MNPRQIYKAVRAFGPRVVAQRIYHALKIKTGLMQKLDPIAPFGPTDLQSHLVSDATPAWMLARRRSGVVPFFFQGADINSFRPILKALIPQSAQDEIMRRVADLERGRVKFFSRWHAELGSPINWLLNPENGVVWPGNLHWSQYGQFDPHLGDLKMVWEAGRFSFAYLLVRAFVLSSDTAPLRLAIELILDWIDRNPPAQGPHWACGQETTFRLMAWLFVLHAAYGTDLLDESMYATILASIYRQAQRVERHIGFSRSIRNNHSLSEAMGLYTIGVLFPEFDAASRWRRIGKHIFVADFIQQVALDGSYIQSSMNYHRVMLHDTLWFVRLARLHGETFEPAVEHRIAQIATFTHELFDEISGTTPNYGANDGAMILPLSESDYTDYRPVVQASYFLAHGKKILEDGPWNEPLLWLFGASSLDAPREDRPLGSTRLDGGGYYTVRGTESWAFTRCHAFKERPVQADELHFDLWWRGNNILRDSGTYRYHSEPPWSYYFNSTAAHNTVVVDGLDQMTKGPRFSWFDWTQGKLLSFTPKPAAQDETWIGEHYGYLKKCGVTHRRRIERVGDTQWYVTDELLGGGRHNATLSWHMGDWAFEWDDERRMLHLQSPVGTVFIRVIAEHCDESTAEIVRGLHQGDEVCGWESLYYGEKTPIPVLRLKFSGSCPMRVVTRIGLGQMPDIP